MQPLTTIIGLKRTIGKLNTELRTVKDQAQYYQHEARVATTALGRYQRKYGVLPLPKHLLLKKKKRPTFTLTYGRIVENPRGYTTQRRPPRFGADVEVAAPSPPRPRTVPPQDVYGNTLVEYIPGVPPPSEQPF